MASAKTAELDLMAEVSAGSVKAFGRLYDRLCARAYRVAYVVCGEKGDAEDVVQEAFLILWKSRSIYRLERGSVAGWLLTVARDRAIDRVRHDRRDAARWAGDETVEARPAPEDVHTDVAFRETAARLRRH